ncbi:MAG: carbohydrate ABC transporter permease [Candidatus Excrementavichristensenella sp.]|jgi:multiple sugar transport system permease protein
MKRVTLRDRDQITPTMFSLPLILCMLTFMLFPFILTVLVSFSNLSLQRMNNPNYRIEFIGLKNFIGIWDSGRLLKIIGRTFVWMGGSLVLGTIIGVFYSLVMTFDIKGKSILKAVILMPWVLPEVITGYVMQMMFMSNQGIIWSMLVKLGLLDPNAAMLSDGNTAMFLVILANTWRAAPYVAVMVYGKFKSLPTSQIEAARIDGANAMQSFFYITIPWIWPIVKRCAILLFIWSFNAYGIIFTMTNGGPANATTNLAIALRNMAFGQYNFGKGAAYGVVILLLILASLGILWLLFVLLMKTSGKRRHIH